MEDQECPEGYYTEPIGGVSDLPSGLIGKGREFSYQLMSVATLPSTPPGYAFCNEAVACPYAARQLWLHPEKRTVLMCDACKALLRFDGRWERKERDVVEYLRARESAPRQKRVSSPLWDSLIKNREEG